MVETLNPVNISPVDAKAAGSAQANSTDDTAVSESSFPDSLKQAFDSRKTDNDKAESGNELPLSGNLDQITAEDDLPVLSADLNLVNQSELILSSIPDTKQLPTEEMLDEAINLQAVTVNVMNDKVITQSVITTAGASDVSEVSILPAGISKKIQADLNETGNKLQSNITASNAVDKSFMQQMMNTQSGSEQSDLPNNKNSFLNMVAQQQLSADLNTSSSQSSINTNVLPLSLSTNSTSSAPMSLSGMVQSEITEQFGKPAWSQGVGKQILWMVNQNLSSAEIRLNPANLGAIEVRIDMSGDQVSVALSSSHGVVREAMEAALPRLREMLDEKGLNLADTDISQHSFAEQRESSFSEDNSTFGGNATNDMAESGMESGQLNGLEALQLLETGRIGMVDYYV